MMDYVMAFVTILLFGMACFAAGLYTGAKLMRGRGLRGNDSHCTGDRTV